MLKFISRGICIAIAVVFSSFLLACPVFADPTWLPEYNSTERVYVSPEANGTIDAPYLARELQLESQKVGVDFRAIYTIAGDEISRTQTGYAVPILDRLLSQWTRQAEFDKQKYAVILIARNRADISKGSAAVNMGSDWRWNIDVKTLRSPDGIVIPILKQFMPENPTGAIVAIAGRINSTIQTQRSINIFIVGMLASVVFGALSIVAWDRLSRQLKEKEEEKQRQAKEVEEFVKKSKEMSDLYLSVASELDKLERKGEQTTKRIDELEKTFADISEEFSEIAVKQYASVADGTKNVKSVINKLEALRSAIAFIRDLPSGIEKRKAEYKEAIATLSNFLPKPLAEKDLTAQSDDLYAQLQKIEGEVIELEGEIHDFMNLQCKAQNKLTAAAKLVNDYCFMSDRVNTGNSRIPPHSYVPKYSRGTLENRLEWAKLIFDEKGDGFRECISLCEQILFDIKNDKWFAHWYSLLLEVRTHSFYSQSEKARLVDLICDNEKFYLAKEEIDRESEERARKERAQKIERARKEEKPKNVKHSSRTIGYVARSNSSSTPSNSSDYSSSSSGSDYSSSSSGSDW